MRDYNIMLAGFGGQGVLFAGKLLAYSGLIDGRELSWMPSYGPEMRGGTANCSVCLSDKPIGSPLVTDPDVLIALNLPSFTKFMPKVVPGGLIIADTSLANVCPERDDVKFIGIPATKIAEDNDLATLGNVICIGVLLKQTGFSTQESLEQAIEKSVSSRHTDLIGPNKKALSVGYNYTPEDECAH
ncbi:MAG: 2-oxoacid:acceptor oxidoreductase family protein [Coriobacteriales bacterium]|jgi:2-oxoglutarate ferredoxin oxidoreductase subunit gamma|nr:2-oxoacid:acceptor oxidoreductase family protein [Coriobacteriales bacterium]